MTLDDCVITLVSDASLGFKTGIAVDSFFWLGVGKFKTIAIERKHLHRSLKQIVEQGVNRLQQGLWVVIFPGRHTGCGG
ncbi:MAG: hypothetical protein R3E08_00625 [Thiotrichaceae bacterium]